MLGTTRDARAVQTADPAGLPESTQDRRYLNIYVHVPFCRSKCHFCDWVQQVPKADLLRGPEDSVRRRYIDALCAEIAIRADQFRHLPYVPYIMYWGGGTASNLTMAETERVFSAIAANYDLTQVAEATIECSPDTVTPERLRHYRELGFTRLSSGVQSFSDSRLASLGRRHGAEQAMQLVGLARAAGFDDISIDVMCGFPDETLAEVVHTVSTAVRLDLTHLCLYPFRPQAGTVLRRQIDRGDATLYLARQIAAYEAGAAIITEAGYPDYAMSNFGRPALQMTMNFQLRCETLGLGSGAVSFLDGLYRGHMAGRLHDYIADPASWSALASLSQPGVVAAALRSGLELHDGLRRRQWASMTGQSLADSLGQPELAPLMRFLRDRGGLIEDGQGVRLPVQTLHRTLTSLSFHSALAIPEPPRHDG